MRLFKNSNPSALWFNNIEESLMTYSLKFSRESR